MSNKFSFQKAPMTSARNGLRFYVPRGTLMFNAMRPHHAELKGVNAPVDLNPSEFVFTVGPESDNADGVPVGG